MLVAVAISLLLCFIIVNVRLFRFKANSAVKMLMLCKY